uniref:Aminotransferase-like plant mobile domain-containing protein n=1 Tax=Oryza rufipogon TaxID=4529 RepID=A0A0E0PLV4_ORYRU
MWNSGSIEGGPGDGDPYGHRTRDSFGNNVREGIEGALGVLMIGRKETCSNMEEEWPYPLLSKEIDARHRAKKISDGNSCSSLVVLIPRTPGWWGIDPRWKPRCINGCQLQPQWARIQVHNVYEYFTEAFESLRENEVRWTPYTNEEAILRAPHGVSILCYHDEAYWMTRKMLVYDIFVEGYNVQRVMRHMGLYQQVPVPIGLHLPPDVNTQKRQADNRFHRSMHSRMTPWIEAWSQALNDVVQETRAYDHNTYEQYMAWYSSQTRIRLLAPEDPDERGPPTIDQIYDMQLAPPAHLTTDIARELVRDAKTLWEKLRDGIAEGTRMVCPVPHMPHAMPQMISQMAPDVPTSHWQGGFAPFAGTSQGIPTIPQMPADFIRQRGFTSLGGPTQSVPLHAPTYVTNPWQGQSMDYGGSFRPELMSGFRPYTASYGDMSSFGGGSSSVPNELRTSQTDDAPQVTQPTQPEVGEGNDNDPRRSNRERHEPNRLSLSGPRHAAGQRKKKLQKSKVDHLGLRLTMTMMTKRSEHYVFQFTGNPI